METPYQDHAITVRRSSVTNKSSLTTMPTTILTKMARSARTIIYFETRQSAAVRRLIDERKQQVADMCPYAASTNGGHQTARANKKLEQIQKE